jgi:hypothetical protein
MRPDVIICDRCGQEARDNQEPGRGNWRAIQGSLVPVVLRTREGAQRREADLCPDCAKSFGEWWKAAKP